MPAVTVVPVQTLGEILCVEPTGALPAGATYCPATETIYWNEPLARDLYDRFGDFVVGYVIGTGFSEAAQYALGSPARGEDRYLASDCLTGAWAGTLIPENADPDDERGAYVEPGDLDEAIQAALVVGDDSSTDDLFGSGFEKIASFREGVLGGLDACLGDLGD